MINDMEWTEVDWDADGRWIIPAVKMKTGWDHVVPLSRQAIAILERVQKITENRRYVFACTEDAPLSAKRSCSGCAHSVSTPRPNIAPTALKPPFSTLCHHEEHKEAKAWDGDVIELQLAHLNARR